jgi:hypothetical protein
MSFFGLTSFGPESVVSANLQNKDGKINKNYFVKISIWAFHR